jgi:exodeoxyribonuclease VII large subunit
VQSYSVGSLVAYMKETLEGDPALYDVWLTGEVASLTRSAAGHVYFRLKDPRAQLNCVMFRLDAPRGGDLIEPGAQLLAHGRVQLYPGRGELQFVADAVQPEGIGAREAEFRRLRDKLAAEGLFDEARKRPLPAFPRRIGVATSPAGAVWHDISTIIARRWPLAELVLAPTPVQGDFAVAGILAALQQLNDEGDLDVMILARGGGSAEELWPFNDERVARAIYASAVPVVSAVGHETDYTLGDYAADRRAPTPSAAAEMVTPDRRELLLRIDRHANAASGLLRRAVERQREALRDAIRRVQRNVPAVDAERARVDRLAAAAAGGLGRGIQAFRSHVLALSERTAALSPLATLARGYALVRKDGGAVVRSAGDVRANDRISVRVADGEFAAEVMS